MTKRGYSSPIPLRHDVDEITSLPFLMGSGVYFEKTFIHAIVMTFRLLRIP
jgi:hypothetical protein